MFPFYLNASVDGLMDQVTFSGLGVPVPASIIWVGTKMYLHAAAKSAAVSDCFMRVADLRTPFWKLLSPGLLARVATWAMVCAVTGA